EAVCKASRPPPPLNNSILAVPAIKNPQTNLIPKVGFNVPLDVMVANTYVAESAEVVKKMKIKNIAIVLVINPRGNSDNIANKAISTSSLTKEASPPFQYISMFKAVDPNVVNQINPSNAGARSTPAINSRIVRPLEILRSEEHTSELQSRFDLVCRLLLEKKDNT